MVEIFGFSRYVVSYLRSTLLEPRRTLLTCAALYVDNSSFSLQICFNAGGALLPVVQLSLLLRGFTLLSGGHAHGPCQSLPRLLILWRELLSIQRGRLENYKAIVNFTSSFLSLMQFMYYGICTATGKCVTMIMVLVNHYLAFSFFGENYYPFSEVGQRIMALVNFTSSFFH